jgi:hypothetical protein
MQCKTSLPDLHKFAAPFVSVLKFYILTTVDLFATVYGVSFRAFYLSLCCSCRTVTCYLSQ